MMTALLAAALVSGPFSKVSVETLTDTPVLVQERLFEAQGEQLLGLGKGMEQEERDGRQVVVTQDGFELGFECELPAGRYAVGVEAAGPSKGADSYWLTVDDRKLDTPLSIPVSVLGQRSAPVSIERDGRHTFRLVLREAPGSVLASVSLNRLSVFAPMPHRC